MAITAFPALPPLFEQTPTAVEELMLARDVLDAIGELEPEAGAIDRPEGWSVAIARQSSPRGDQAALDFVLAGDDALADNGQTMTVLIDPRAIG